MCLLAFQYDEHPEYRLVFAGNRDEFYDRPTASAGYWEDAPHVLAGRDLKAGGTWMGVTTAGHWGVVTNIREQPDDRKNARSRGTLVADYLREEAAPRPYLEQVAASAERYNGFNLLLGTPDSLYYFSNRASTVEQVEPGLHGLSNDKLDSPWPKVTRATSALQRLVDEGAVSTDALLEILEDPTPAPRDELPDTGLPPEREQALSSIFINGDTYGTRASTVLVIGRSGDVTFVERTFDRGEQGETQRFHFQLRKHSRESQSSTS